MQIWVPLIACKSKSQRILKRSKSIKRGFWREDKQVRKLEAELKDEKEKNARPPILELDLANLDCESPSFDSDDYGDVLALSSARGDSNQNNQLVIGDAADSNHSANDASDLLGAVNQPGDENQIVPAAPAWSDFN